MCVGRKGIDPFLEDHLEPVVDAVAWFILRTEVVVELFDDCLFHLVRSFRFSELIGGAGIKEWTMRYNRHRYRPVSIKGKKLM